jgi:hypothetical protein
MLLPLFACDSYQKKPAKTYQDDRAEANAKVKTTRSALRPGI